MFHYKIETVLIIFRQYDNVNSSRLAHFIETYRPLILKMYWLSNITIVFFLLHSRFNELDTIFLHNDGYMIKK